MFVEQARDEFDVKRAILFGSYAKGNFTEESDIDVCIVINGIENNFSAALTIAPKVIKIDSRIEPVVFSVDEFENEGDFGLLKEIKNYGITVF